MGHNYIIPHCEEFLAAPLETPPPPPPFLHVVKVLRRRAISSIYIKHVYIVDREPRKLLSLTQIMLVNHKAEIINPASGSAAASIPATFICLVSYVLFISTADSRYDVCPDVTVPQTQVTHPKATLKRLN